MKRVCRQCGQPWEAGRFDDPNICPQCVRKSNDLAREDLKRIIKRDEKNPNQFTLTISRPYGPTTCISCVLPPLKKIRLVQSIVAEYYGLPLPLMLSRSREYHIAIPRMASMYICKMFTGNSQVSIERAYKLQHGTLDNASQTIARIISTDDRKWCPGVLESIRLCKQALGL